VRGAAHMQQPPQQHAVQHRAARVPLCVPIHCGPCAG
jgi:hypothetical protein